MYVFLNYAAHFDKLSVCSYCQIIRHTILSQHSVKIGEIPCYLKGMAFSIKCTLFLFAWENVLTAFEYETVKFYLIATISYKRTINGE